MAQSQGWSNKSYDNAAPNDIRPRRFEKRGPIKALERNVAVLTRAGGQAVEVLKELGIGA